MTITIKVKFKNVELEMSSEEAKELAQILKGLTTKEVEYVPYYPYNPWTIPWTGPTWVVNTCSSDATTVYTVSASTR